MARGLDLKKHKREIILGGVLLTLAVVFLARQLWPSSGGGGGGASILVTEPPPAVAVVLSQLASVELPDVLLDRLEEESATYDPTQRNIFRYGKVKPPPPDPEELARIAAAKKAAQEARLKALEEERKRKALLEKQRAEMPPAPSAPSTPPPPPRPTPPAITLRYSGFLGSFADRIAVLYKEDDLILARVGDTVDKKFRLLDVGYDWVRIGYVDPQFEDQYQKLRMGP